MIQRSLDNVLEFQLPSRIYDMVFLWRDGLYFTSRGLAVIVNFPHRGFSANEFRKFYLLCSSFPPPEDMSKLFFHEGSLNFSIFSLKDSRL